MESEAFKPETYSDEQYARELAGEANRILDNTSQHTLSEEEQTTRYTRAKVLATLSQTYVGLALLDQGKK